MNILISPLVRDAVSRQPRIAARLLVLVACLAGAGVTMATPILSADPGPMGSHVESAARPAWSVDYPSQLGPDGPSTADAARPAPLIDGSMRPGWNADYPSQIGPEWTRAEASPQAVTDARRSVPKIEADLPAGWNADYPSQIGAEGPLAEAH